MSTTLPKAEIDALMKAVSDHAIPQKEPAKNHGRGFAGKEVKLYDFRRPVMFLMDQLRTLQMIHEAFARNFANALAGYLRTTVGVRCLSATQLSYSEFTSTLPEPCTMANIRFHPSEGHVLLAISPVVGGSVVDRVMGGSGTAEGSNQPFTEIEQFVIDDFVAIALTSLEAAWTRLVTVSFTLQSIDYTTQLVHVATQEETVVAVALELAFGDSKGTATFCYPFRALNPIIERLNARQWVAEDSKPFDASHRRNITNALNQIPVKVSARLGSASLTMEELMNLRAGDVFVLNKQVDELAELEIAGRGKFKGHLGVRRGKLAIQVSQISMQADAG